MTNFAAEYIREFGGAKEVQHLKNPIEEISDYYLGKIVFTGTNFGNVSPENKGEIYSSLLSALEPISKNEIKVISLEQGVGTSDPKVITYTFHITTFHIDPIDNLDLLYELNPSGIAKEIKQIGEKKVLKLPVKNNLKQESPKLQVFVVGIKEKLGKLFRSN